MGRRQIVGMAVTLVAAAVIAGCDDGVGGSTSTTSTGSDAGASGEELAAQPTGESARIARYITVGIADQLGVVLYVRCPDDIPDEQDATFTCVARSSDSAELAVEATVGDTPENVTWDFDALSTTQIARSIAGDVKEQRSVNVTVDCPDVITPREGEEFECEVRDADGTRYTVLATQVDDQGGVRWRVAEAGE